MPSVLLTPVAITKNNWKLLISDGFLKKSEVCKGEYAQYCWALTSDERGGGRRPRARLARADPAIRLNAARR